MTRKDYIALAAALASTRPDIEREPFATHSAVGDNTFTNHITFEAASDAWTATRDAIADALDADNPDFNRKRFNAATEGR